MNWRIYIYIIGYGNMSRRIYLYSIGYENMRRRIYIYSIWYGNMYGTINLKKREYEKDDTSRQHFVWE